MAVAEIREEIDIDKIEDLVDRYQGLSDNELTRFVYDFEGVLGPEISSEALRDSIVPHPEVADNFDEWLDERSYNRQAAFEIAVATRSEVELCRGPNQIHEWKIQKYLIPDIRVVQKLSYVNAVTVRFTCSPIT